MSAAAPEAEAAATAAEGEAKAVESPPPGPSPPRPPQDKLFCSFEGSLEDVRVYKVEMTKAGSYVRTLASIRFRQVKLAPFFCHGAPVTRLINPKTGFSSHFIIRFKFKNHPKYMVDCLVRDNDLYFVGFRRHLDLTEEDARSLPKKKKKKAKGGKGNEEEEEEKKKKGGWGTWYRFLEDDMKLPKFFHAESCGNSSSYVEKELAEAGGVDAVQEMFFAFATFQDKLTVDNAFKKACYRFMIMFCEACRLRSVFRVTTKRFMENVTYQVPVQLWPRINNWGQMGRDALHARLRGRDLDYDISNWSTKVQGLDLKTVNDLVGPHDGEILLIKCNDAMMGYEGAEVEEFRAEACRTNTRPADALMDRF